MAAHAAHGIGAGLLIEALNAPEYSDYGLLSGAAAVAIVDKINARPAWGTRSSSPAYITWRAAARTRRRRSPPTPTGSGEFAAGHRHLGDGPLVHPEIVETDCGGQRQHRRRNRRSRLEQDRPRGALQAAGADGPASIGERQNVMRPAGRAAA